jgi:hypothetical protein
VKGSGSEVLIPVLLSAAVWPGAGQIRNRELVKGVLLAGLTLSLLGALLVRIASDLWPLIAQPPDAGVLVPVVETAVTRALVGHTILLTLLAGLWVYSILDAFFVARSLAR